jgi:hypothetical protein
MIDRSDTTPFATRVILVAVLAITVAVRFTWLSPEKPADVAPFLWLFTFLFVLRVLGQVLVAIRPQQWLPPMEQWNFIPYPILLPIQIVFIAIMTWINMSFSLSEGISIASSPGLGTFLIASSVVYVLTMLIRYVIRMHRSPDQRWFGGTIPIVFHVVLASYLYALGSFYVTT